MFRKGIQKMIETYQGKMLVINRLSPLCICAKSTSGEADSKCSHCFGTGKQVSLKEIYGVVQESNGSSTMRRGADYTITKEIFIDSKYSASVDDLIIHDKQVFKIYQIKTFRLQNNDPIYFIAYATPLKYDSDFVIQELLKIGVIK